MESTAQSLSIDASYNRAMEKRGLCRNSHLQNITIFLFNTTSDLKNFKHEHCMVGHHYILLVGVCIHAIELADINICFQTIHVPFSLLVKSTYSKWDNLLFSHTPCYYLAFLHTYGLWLRDRNISVAIF